MSMGIAQMTSLMSSQNTLKHLGDLNSVRTSLKGSAAVSSSEIETDKERGVDTKWKEEALAGMEEHLQSVGDDMMDSASQLNERIAADREKIREEEAEEERAVRKAKEKADAAKTGTGASVSSGGKAASNAVTSVAEPVDTAEFSPAAKAAVSVTVQAEPDTASGSGVYTPTTGTVIDKKV